MIRAIGRIIFHASFIVVFTILRWLAAGLQGAYSRLIRFHERFD